MLEEGGIAEPTVKLNSNVVTSMEVFKPNRKPTEEASLRLNKKEKADTIAKIVGGIIPWIFERINCLCWVTTISALGRAAPSG